MRRWWRSSWLRDALHDEHERPWAIFAIVMGIAFTIGITLSIVAPDGKQACWDRGLAAVANPASGGYGCVEPPPSTTEGP